MSRDQQRQKVYNAEDVLRRAISRSGSTLPKDKQIPKGDVAAATGEPAVVWPAVPDLGPVARARRTVAAYMDRQGLR